jgi:hypothetical protein
MSISQELLFARHRAGLRPYIVSLDSELSVNQGHFN